MVHITYHLDRYKQNLKIVEMADGKYVKSYDTLVGKIEPPYLYQLGWWSKTTQKHINYVAEQFRLTIVK